MTLENKTIKINYPETLSQFALQSLSLLEQKIKKYKIIFNCQNIEPITINYFDNINEFRNFIYDIRGEKESLPNYATGTCDNGMINAYIDPNNQINRRYTASHELFHILYMKYILNNDYTKRIVWYDEGMAQLMSGEMDYLYVNDNFELFYQKVKEETKQIPNINNIDHGTNFCNENYNGYDLSFLALKYLQETLNNEQFLQLAPQFSKIKMLGNNIVQNMFEYYDEKFKKVTKK